MLESKCHNQLSFPGEAARTATTGDGPPSHATGHCWRRGMVERRASSLSVPEVDRAPERGGLHGLLDRLSAALVQCPIATVDAHLDELVGQVGRYLVVDHAELFRPALNGAASDIVHRWSRPEYAPPATFDAAADLPWITSRLRDGKPVYVTRPEELPDEAAADRAGLLRLGLRSIAGLPVLLGGAPAGWLFFATLREHRPWPALRVEQLRRTAEIAESAVARVQADLALRRAIEFDQAVAEVAATLMHVPSDAIDAHIVESLETFGELLGADRASIFGPVSPGALSRTHLWVRPGTPRPPIVDSRDAFPWMMGRLYEQREVIALTQLDELPPEAARDRASLERNVVASCALAPMVVEDRVVGIISFVTAHRERRWSPDLVARLRLVGGILAAAIGRLESDRALQQAVGFDQAVATLAASLMRVPADQIDDAIAAALGELGELLGADRAAVIQRDLQQGLLVRTHLWVRSGEVGPPRVDSLDGYPWLISRLYDARELVALTRLDELPPEAARDRETLEQNGVVSGALAPMVIGDRVFGELMFATSTRELSWSPDLVARLRLVGEIIASALARRDAELALRKALAENEGLRERLTAENLYLQTELVEAQDFGEIVGQSPSLRTALQKVRQVADTTAPVLLLGETGTGKELLARAIHAQSRRCGRAFIAINCAALPPTLIESELFGHEKGAFTGAIQAKAGRFELADQGTLLLDEIGELESALQAKLLRVLEDGEIQRLGSTATRKVDVRIIAATNRNLRKDARESRFRSDLYYRLSVFPIELTPLRERRDDIPLLVWHFIQSRQRALGRSIQRISKAAMASLQAYEWPGNVRELQNVIERAMILSEGPVLRVEEALGAGAADREAGERRHTTDSLHDTERAHIIAVLERCAWTIEGRGQAAERLGLNPSTLRNRMRKLGIKRPAP
jgi:formate hydrogenlyase transcriptional activator